MLRSHLLPPYHSRLSSDPDHLSPRLSPALQPGGAWGCALMAPEPDLAPPAHCDPLPPTPQGGRSSVVSRLPSAPRSGFAGSVTRRLCERFPHCTAPGHGTGHPPAPGAPSSCHNLLTCRAGQKLCQGDTGCFALLAGRDIAVC